MTKGDFIPPGTTLGVLGGGQLGRMFVQAAQRAGYAAVVLDPERASPAGRVAERQLVAAYDDERALIELAAVSSAVTTEFENVPAAALETLARHVAVAPGAASVAVCQDRRDEKAAFARAGIAAAPHAAIASDDDLARVDASLFPGILKTARLGYDGKGQRPVASRDEARAAFAAFGGAACVLEQRLALAAEVSAIVARGRDGSVVHLPLQENVHRDGILALTRVPATAVDAGTARDAIALAERMAGALDHVGVLCLECFVLADGRLVANEMAPRPHNSGHHSIDSCDLSQFDLQRRTMTNAPLVAPRLHSPAVMLNLLGDLWLANGRRQTPDWAPVLRSPGACLHLYGKVEPRAGRKMGHLTFIAATAEEADARARDAARHLGIDVFDGR